MFQITFFVIGDNSAIKFESETKFAPRVGDAINFGDIGCAIVDDVVWYVYPADGATRGWRDDAIVRCKLLSETPQDYDELRQW